MHAQHPRKVLADVAARVLDSRQGAFKRLDVLGAVDALFQQLPRVVLGRPPFPFDQALDGVVQQQFHTCNSTMTSQLNLSSG